MGPETWFRTAVMLRLLDMRRLLMFLGHEMEKNMVASKFMFWKQVDE